MSEQDKARMELICQFVEDYKTMPTYHEMGIVFGLSNGGVQSFIQRMIRLHRLLVFEPNDRRTVWPANLEIRRIDA